MSLGDIIVIAIVVLLVCGALWKIRRGKGGCSCGCAGCTQKCDKRK